SRSTCRRVISSKSVKTVKAVEIFGSTRPLSCMRAGGGLCAVGFFLIFAVGGKREFMLYIT
ncbi:MAG: hypothetical protein K2K78_04460, partial [Muribaculaceae bacterium]|nr:hypothetical protein [Muribaculaceae bacterium]